MSDFASTPSDSAPAPEPAQAAPSLAVMPATPQERREEAQRLMHSPDYLSEHSHIRAPLVRRVRELLEADHPTDTRPRDPVTDMLLGDAPEAPPATAMEIYATVADHVSFPTHVHMADRGDFIEAAHAGLVALQVSRTDAGWFTHAANEVLRAPDTYTPESAERALRASWGGSYAENLAAAKAAVQRLPLAVRMHLTETPIANHPRIMDMLAKAGRRMAAKGTR